MFAGLVVPGYLAAVFVLDPRAGIVNVVEAVFTYGLARLIGEHISRTGLTSRAFGRERFLLVVLSSVVVRLAFEGGDPTRDLRPTRLGSFFSIGLVVGSARRQRIVGKPALGGGLVENGVPDPSCLLAASIRSRSPDTNLSLAGFELANGRRRSETSWVPRRHTSFS